jgi:uncharacterized BrkB/YihY/UPF0761 family membrane protein
MMQIYASSLEDVYDEVEPIVQDHMMMVFVLLIMLMMAVMMMMLMLVAEVSME